ncbi:type II toxin-antitoxin system RelE/ParE family toxin (plasmid) [Mesorhizobium mediterraneum]|uniref:Addiction module toxin RelE n=1 Tax=Mesorhizobium mediterraneum TaxID=43617 RepID=A0AB36RL06_9HYPH|nr:MULTISPECIES: type II toxin-antitoxin system RelE/ParE family toxin [Mesorhizobium]PAQ04279.1 addiction module toxin RelE [Mesorhizobium mediterraneum]RUU73701.1 type II toxin-antitoxin system RelE/ParE family toxin [Mesorhizobium sp. M7A.F.Ca.MR.362.00.0.0]RUU85189.1 type II toxin-antitoxin system RelE/ParE family toxin [Mesorhizobium sp. M7A.F.Ca.MR.176.00.0.0]RWA99576.1 MAG: type II toxin-antitoxin system RelE/ParE family toxin [Mesorhizobium sp.]RWB09441.1 MAG: type II toxin-antitoxin s
MTQRTFKTAWFAKAARKARIRDVALCKAIAQVALGQAEDLGGGVFKKRLNDNRHRSIILAKSGRFWVYEYLFAKQDRANIDDDELAQFRSLAKAYAGLTDRQLGELLADGDFLEICT